MAQLARDAFDQAFIAVLATAAAILLAAGVTIRQLHLRQSRVAMFI